MSEKFFSNNGYYKNLDDIYITMILKVNVLKVL